MAGTILRGVGMERSCFGSLVGHAGSCALTSICKVYLTILLWPGPYLHSIEISNLDQCSSEIAKDGDTFGIACVAKLLQYQEVLVDYPTAIQRLKEDALISHSRMSTASAANADVLIIANATILTMEGETFAEEPIRGGALVTRGGLIEEVVEGQSLRVPEGATVIDAQGGKEYTKSCRSGSDGLL